MHAFLWRIYHTFVLGWILKAQSDSKFLVRHFLKHYHYSSSNLESGRGAVQEAFSNFKGLYNLAMCMTYSAFVAYHIMGSIKKNLKSRSRALPGILTNFRLNGSMVTIFCVILLDSYVNLITDDEGELNLLVVLDCIACMGRKGVI